MPEVKTVMITGASRGIGAACAELFGQKGFNVAVCGFRSMEQAGQVCAKINKDYPHAAYFAADVADAGQVRAMAAQVLDRFGRIDILVNCAGIAWQGLFQDMSEEQMHRIVDVNLFGALHCTKAVLPEMLKRKSGSIVNVSSIWGVHGASCEAVYAASKGALIAFTKSLAKELGPSGIRVNCVAPGVIETEMTVSLGAQTLNDLAEETPLGRNGTAADTARAVLYLAGPASSFVTGAVLNVNGGLLT